MTTTRHNYTLGPCKVRVDYDPHAAQRGRDPYTAVVWCPEIVTDFSAFGSAPVIKFDSIAKMQTYIEKETGRLAQVLAAEQARVTMADAAFAAFVATCPAE